MVDFVIHWNETAMGFHVFPIPIPPPTKRSCFRSLLCYVSPQYTVTVHSGCGPWSPSEEGAAPSCCCECWWLVLTPAPFSAELPSAVFPWRLPCPSPPHSQPLVVSDWHRVSRALVCGSVHAPEPPVGSGRGWADWDHILTQPFLWPLLLLSSKGSSFTNSTHKNPCIKF